MVESSSTVGMTDDSSQPLPDRQERDQLLSSQWIGQAPKEQSLLLVYNSINTLIQPRIQHPATPTKKASQKSKHTTSSMLEIHPLLLHRFDHIIKFVHTCPAKSKHMI